MRNICIIFCIVSVLFIPSCENTKKGSIKYYTNNSFNIIEFTDKNLVYYNLKDSTTDFFHKKKDYIIHEKTKKEIKYSLTNNTLRISDNQNVISQKNSLEFDLIDYIPNKTSESILKCWSFNDDGNNILCFDEDFYSYYYKSNFNEKNHYKIVKYFDKFDLFISDDGLAFFKSSFFLTEINEKSLVLWDIKTVKKNTFSNYISKKNEDLFNSWRIVPGEIQGDSLQYFKKDGALSVLGKKMTFKRPSTLYRVSSNNKRDTFNFKSGLNTKSIFLKDDNYFHVKKLTKDSLILYDESILLSKYREKIYTRVNESDSID